MQGMAANTLFVRHRGFRHAREDRCRCDQQQEDRDETGETMHV
jgi:hypothetical protein